MERKAPRTPRSPLSDLELAGLIVALCERRDMNYDESIPETQRLLRKEFGVHASLARIEQIDLKAVLARGCGIEATDLPAAPRVRVVVELDPARVRHWAEDHGSSEEDGDPFEQLVSLLDGQEFPAFLREERRAGKENEFETTREEFSGGDRV